MKNSMYGRITTKVAKAMGRGVYWSDRDNAWMTCEGYRVEGIVRAAVDAKPEENYTVKEALGILVKALRADPGLRLSPLDSAVVVLDPEVTTTGLFFDPTGKQVACVVPVRQGDLKMVVTPIHSDDPVFGYGDTCIQEKTRLDGVEVSLEATSKALYGTNYALWMVLDEV